MFYINSLGELSDILGILNISHLVDFDVLTSEWG